MTRKSASGRAAIALFLTATMILSVAAGAIAAGPSDDLNFDGDTHAPNPYLDVGTLTVAEYPMSEGTSASAVPGYYDDNGNWVDDPGYIVNTTMDKEAGDNVNPYSYKPAHVDADFLGTFPRVDGESENSHSALDASEWTVNSNSANVTVSDTSVDSNVGGVQFDFAGKASVGYANWTTELDSDESKRVIQVGADVDQLQSNARINITVTDESGDEKSITIDPDDPVDTDANVMANSTGDHVYQIKLSKVPTDGGGSWDNIESINVSQTVAGGSTAADITISWLDVERKTKTVLGDQRVDSDGDGTYDETTTVYNSTGYLSVSSLDTLGSEYDSATLVDLQYPAKFKASLLDGNEAQNGSYVMEMENASEYPPYSSILNVSYRLHAPGVIDLSYSDVDLQVEQGFPDDRYLTVGYTTGFGADTNLSSASHTDASGSLSASSGDTIELSSNVGGGQYVAVKFEMLLTSAEEDSITSVSGGGVGPTGDTSGGGFLSMLFSIPGMLVTAAAGILGWSWLKR